MAYESGRISKDIADYIYNMLIKNYISCKNLKKIRKKCNRLSRVYLENDRLWGLQENWFCLLAYILAIVTMVCRILEMNTVMNDRASFLIYFGALVVWYIITNQKRFMGKNAEIILNAFNNQAPSLTIITSLLFYMVIVLELPKIIWIFVVVISVVGSIFLTWLWYRRQKDSFESV